LCVTRDDADRYVVLVQALNISPVLGRNGQRLLAADDDLFSWAAASSGRGFGIFPELRISHLIPAERLSRAHVIARCRGHKFSHSVFRYRLMGTFPKRLDLSTYIRVFLHGIKNGLLSMQCQWAEHRGQHDAARFIDVSGLQPLGTTDWAAETLHLDQAHG
jgi:hypothetical protein